MYTRTVYHMEHTQLTIVITTRRRYIDNNTYNKNDNKKKFYKGRIRGYGVIFASRFHSGPEDSSSVETSTEPTLWERNYR